MMHTLAVIGNIAVFMLVISGIAAVIIEASMPEGDGK